MNSEENLAESEFQEEMKPRLTITDEMQLARYAGHKMDMRERDPTNMNDHVKVRFCVKTNNAGFIPDDVQITSALRRGHLCWWVGSAK